MPGSLLLGEEVCGDRWDRAEDEWEDEDNVRLGREHEEALGAGGHWRGTPISNCSSSIVVHDTGVHSDRLGSATTKRRSR